MSMYSTHNPFRSAFPTSFVSSSVKRSKRRKGTGADRAPHRPEKVAVVMNVVNVQQHRRRHLVALQQVVDVRAAVVGAREAVAPGDRAHRLSHTPRVKAAALTLVRFLSR